MKKILIFIIFLPLFSMAQVERPDRTVFLGYEYLSDINDSTYTIEADDYIVIWDIDEMHHSDSIIIPASLAVEGRRLEFYIYQNVSMGGIQISLSGKSCKGALFVGIAYAHNLDDTFVTDEVGGFAILYVKNAWHVLYSSLYEK